MLEVLVTYFAEFCVRLLSDVEIHVWSKYKRPMAVRDIEPQGNYTPWWQKDSSARAFQHSQRSRARVRKVQLFQFTAIVAGRPGWHERLKAPHSSVGPPPSGYQDVWQHPSASATAGRNDLSQSLMVSRCESQSIDPTLNRSSHAHKRLSSGVVNR